MKQKTSVEVKLNEDGVPNEIICDNATYKIEYICLLEPIFAKHRDLTSVFEYLLGYRYKSRIWVNNKLETVRLEHNTVDEIWMMVTR